MILINSFQQASDPTGDIQVDGISALAILDRQEDNLQVDAISALAILNRAGADGVQVDAISAIAILNRTYP